MLITQDTKNNATSSWVAAWIAVTAEIYVIGIEEVEEQVPVKGGRTHYCRPHEARSLL